MSISRTIQAQVNILFDVVKQNHDPSKEEEQLALANECIKTIQEQLHQESKEIKLNDVLNTRDENGDTLLILGAINKHTAIIRVLLEHNADPYLHSSKDGVIPLPLAAARNHIDVVECLIEHKVDPNLADKHGEVALTAATFQNHKDMVKYLLAHKADPDLRNGFNSLAINSLMFATRKGLTGIVKQLLESKANPNIITYTLLNDYSLPYDLRNQSPRFNEIKLLLEHGATIKNLENPFTLALYLKNTPKSEQNTAQIDFCFGIFHEQLGLLKNAKEYYKKALSAEHKYPCVAAYKPLGRIYEKEAYIHDAVMLHNQGVMMGDVSNLSHLITIAQKWSTYPKESLVLTAPIVSAGLSSICDAKDAKSDKHESKKTDKTILNYFTLPGKIYSHLMTAAQNWSIYPKKSVALQAPIVPAGPSSSICDAKDAKIEEQESKEADKAIINYFTLTEKIYFHLKLINLHIDLTIDQWLMIAVDAPINKHFEKRPMEGIHLALRTIRKAEEKIRATEEKTRAREEKTRILEEEIRILEEEIRSVEKSASMTDEKAMIASLQAMAVSAKTETEEGKAWTAMKKNEINKTAGVVWKFFIQRPLREEDQMQLKEGAEQELTDLVGDFLAASNEERMILPKVIQNILSPQRR